MELIQRYVQAVTDCLAENQRAEVARELSASIEDMARDKSGGKKPTREQIAKVLEEMGDPLVVARQYKDTGEYLIGPTLYYQYVQLLKYVFAMSLPIYTLVFAITRDYELPLRIGSLLVAYGGGLFSVALHVLFWVTALFFIMEKTGVKIDQINDGKEEWSVDSLPALSHQSQVSRIDAILSLGFYAFLIAGGTILWQMLSQGAQTTVVATYINPQLTQFWIPALIVFGIIGSVVEVAKLIIGRWRLWLAGASLVVNALGIMYVAALASSDVILNPALSAQAYKIGTWSIGITAIIFIFFYLYDSYEIVKRARTTHKKI